MTRPADTPLAAAYRRVALELVAWIIEAHHARERHETNVGLGCLDELLRGREKSAAHELAKLARLRATRHASTANGGRGIPISEPGARRPPSRSRRSADGKPRGDS